MTAQKKQWQTPQLTVLVRSRPEEAVLAACKYAGMSGSTGGKNACRAKVTGKCTGMECSALAGS